MRIFNKNPYLMIYIKKTDLKFIQFQISFFKIFRGRMKDFVSLPVFSGWKPGIRTYNVRLNHPKHQNRRRSIIRNMAGYPG